MQSRDFFNRDHRPGITARTPLRSATVLRVCVQIGRVGCRVHQLERAQKGRIVDNGHGRMADDRAPDLALATPLDFLLNFAPLRALS